MEKEIWELFGRNTLWRRKFGSCYAARRVKESPLEKSNKHFSKRQFLIVRVARGEDGGRFLIENAIFSPWGLLLMIFFPVVDFSVGVCD